MKLKVAQFFAIVLTALALVPVGAHLLEFANKTVLLQEQYFIVQGIYNGWALLGVVLIAAILANLVLAWLLRGRGPAFGFALAGFLCVAATLAIFFAWTFPANQATANWTQAPENWAALRHQWEVSHAANAVLTFAGLCALVIATLIAKDRD
jgi:hypothetical protein